MHRQINKMLMLYSEEIVKKRLPIMLTSWENLRIKYGKLAVCNREKADGGDYT